MQANDGSGQYILTVFPAVDRKSSKNAIRFTEELYQLELPPGVAGPVGETPIFAEIVMVVKGEVWWLMLLTVSGVFFFIYLDVRKVRDVLLILVPLAAGMVVTFGVMAIVGFPLNLFNVIVLPALIGMGVDDGVHFFDRWKENGRNSRKTFSELLNPMFLTTFTTTLGYAGMVFAHHPGLRSIGLLAFLGMMLIWATTVYLLPAVLDFTSRKKKSAAAG
jgi:predicted RND superfamily exporter protein